MVKVVTLTSTLTNASEYRVTAVLSCDIMNKLHDKNCLAYSCASEKTDLTGAVDALKEALKGTDMDAIKTKHDELQKKVYAVSEKVYKAAGEAANAAGAAGGDAQNADAAGQKADGNVYDADYTDVDDTKK